MISSDLERHLADLLAAMTLEEKIGQLNMLTADYVITGPTLSANYLAMVRSGGAGSLLNLWGAGPTREAQRLALEETRLGIPLLLGFDVVHGHRTIFPVPLGEAAAFDPVLWERTARAAAIEAAADGLNVTFAPMLDVARDPRWGRMVEGTGEDRWVAQRYATAKVRGFQGDDLAAADSVVATAKHLAAYGAVLAGREYASVDISERELYEVHLPPFRAAVAAGTAAIMPAFNDIAGVPMTANGAILDHLVRRRWGFDGLMISDYNAITELIAHGVAADVAEAAALALNAGVDIDMMGDAYHRGLPEALSRGLVSLETIDLTVRRVLALKARIGLFDDPYRRGRTPVPPEIRASHQELSREAARRAIVLMTNRDETLPFKPNLSRIAVLGPLAASRKDMIGPWSGAGIGDDAVSFLDGIQAALPAVAVTHASGVAIEGTDFGGIAEALDLAKAAELVVLCLGESVSMSGEASARGRPDLPGMQRRLAEAVLDLGVPVVVVLGSGRPLMVEWLFERAQAVLAVWHLGSQAGHGLADILTGRAVPTGRLPLSWPVELGQVPIFFGRRPTGRPADPAVHYSAKYIDLPTEPLFPFGHGLSYAAFEWRALRVSSDRLVPGTPIVVEAEIANVGAIAAEETAFFFIRDPVASVARPVLELRGVVKVHIAPGDIGTARLELQSSDFAFPGAAPHFEPVLEPGGFEILAGPNASHAGLLMSQVTYERPQERG